MRMPSVQFTVRGMMLTTAVIALDCFALVITDGAGVLLIGLLLNVGFVRWCRTQGRRRRFWGGFVAAGLVVVLAYIGCIQVLGDNFAQWPLFILINTPQYLPTWAGEWLDNFIGTHSRFPLSFAVAIFEVGFGLPMLLLASIGGLLSTFTWHRQVANSDAVLSAAAEA
jgi:hypothetical protein